MGGVPPLFLHACSSPSPGLPVLIVSCTNSSEFLLGDLALPHFQPERAVLPDASISLGNSVGIEKRGDSRRWA